MNILVMGAGAIGCFVGGCLAAAGQEVTLVGRPRLMQQVAVDGLTLLWPNQPAQKIFLQTETTVTNLGPTYDFILLTVKTPDTAAATGQLRHLSPELGRTYIVSLQNGLGNEEQLAATFRPEQIIAGTITLPIRTPAPGVIEVSKAKGGLGLAPVHSSPSASELAPIQLLAEALNQAGLRTVMYTDYRAMKWSKLLLNIVNNASCAILNQPPAQIITQPDLFNLEIEALREAVAVMKAHGIQAANLPGYPVAWLARLVAARWLPMVVTRAILRPFMRSGRGAKMPSLQIDLAAGRSTSEVEALNGAIVRAGQALGIATPVNQSLTHILSGLVAGQLDWTSYQNQPAKLVEAVALARGINDPVSD